MDAATAGLIGAFGGALVGLLGAWTIDRAQTRRTAQLERRRAFGHFLGALYSAVGEFRDMPPDRAGGLFEKLDSVLTTDQLAWVQARRGIARTSPELFGRLDRLLLSVAQLQVLDLPIEVSAAVDDATRYVEQLAATRTTAQKEEWWAVRERLLDAGWQL
jgi:hypothetical protein